MGLTGPMDPNGSETSRKSALATRSGPDWQAPERKDLGNQSRQQTRIFLQLLRDSGLIASRCPQMRNCASGNDELCPRPLVADTLQFHRPVGNRDPESGADGAFDQMDVAAMGAHQFGGNG